MNQSQNTASQALINDIIKDQPSESHSVHFLSGEVIALMENRFTVSAADTTLSAERAFDCLAEPEVGDLVVLTITPFGNYISQILMRKSDAPLSLSVSNDLCIASKGSLRINGQQGLQIQSPAELEMNSEKLTVNNLSTRFRTFNLFFQAKEAESNVGRLKLVAEWIEQKAETIRQRFTRSDRVVREADQQQAGSLVQRVDKTASLRAEHTIIKARKDVQVDGKRIHMG